jgi:nicotinamide-nucleotide amidase
VTEVPGSGAGGDLAAQVVALLRARGLTLAVAESLTGGALTARLVDVPGASDVLRGGIVAYASDLKERLLGVDGELLARRGAIDPDVAVQMAAGARAQLGASVAVATTGVAGPAGQDGATPGTVHVALVDDQGSLVRSARLPGGRPQVRAGAVDLALGLLRERLAAG